MIKKIIATLFTKGFVALINLAILLISSKQLGVDNRGQVSLLILNIAIIQAINEIYTGYALVYFVPRYDLKKIYQWGFVWSLACCAFLSLFFFVFSIGIQDQWIHVALLSVIIIIHSFHGVILLAKEKIKLYNFLNFFQPGLLLLVLMIEIYCFNYKTADSYIIALYASFLSALFLSSIQIIRLFKHLKDATSTFNSGFILKNGFYNQLANLSHMLSNRYNFYLLGSTVLVGVYSSSASLIESVLIISSSAATIILMYIANEKAETKNVQITFLLAKICLLLSLFCIGILILIPETFFTFLLGKDFVTVKTVMLHLAPGILFISFSTIISHYFAGHGKQKYIVVANGLGLLATISTSHFFINKYQLIGACYATSLSYFVASFILVMFFMRENKLGLSSLFQLKEDFKIFKSM
jgi:O-antigen/teichoic acid export membrane protein